MDPTLPRTYSYPVRTTDVCEVCRANVAVVERAFEGSPHPPAKLCEQCEARIEEPTEALLSKLVNALRNLFRRRSA